MLKNDTESNFRTRNHSLITMGDESHFLTSCEALKDERFDLEQFLNDKDEDFLLYVVMRRLHEKSVARIVMNMWNRIVDLL